MSLLGFYRVTCDNVYCEHEDIIDSKDIPKHREAATAYFKESGWLFVEESGEQNNYCCKECVREQETFVKDGA